MTFKDLPLELRTHILGSAYYLPDPADLARFRAVSRAMRDAVDATGREITEMCTCCAAKLGCLTTLQTQLRRGRLDETVVCEAAALGGQREILVWAREHDCELGGVRTSASAAKGGHLEVLKWLREKGCPWDDQIGWMAAEGGHVDLLRWAHDRGCPLLNEWTFAFAAEGGSLEALEWLRARGCPRDARACEHAAQGGHLDVLKWLFDLSCPWDARTCAWAANRGNLGMLEWLRERGCPWDHKTCASARDNGHLGVYDWARANGCPDCDPDDRTGRSKRSNELMETIERFFGEEEDEDDDDDDDDDDDET